MGDDHAPASHSRAASLAWYASQHGRRRYDSFILRVWRDGTGDSLPRLELEHIQTGLVTSELNGTLTWVVEALTAFLAPQVDSTKAPDD